MAFKLVDNILQSDPRFAELCIVENGVTRCMTLADHHALLAGISLTEQVPKEIHAAFDRARNALIYAFFDYDLLVVGEVQAAGAFELALKLRLNGSGGTASGGLRNLVERARKKGILPPRASGTPELSDPILAIIHLRNGLSHGTSDVHSPRMALDLIEACASWINHVYSPQPGTAG